MDNIPTTAEMLQIAPIATLVVMVVGLGYWVGYKSQKEYIETLKEWIGSINNKRD